MLILPKIHPHRNIRYNVWSNIRTPWSRQADIKLTTSFTTMTISWKKTWKTFFVTPVASLEEEIFHSSLENTVDRGDGGLQCRLSRRIGHDWATKHAQARPPYIENHVGSRRDSDSWDYCGITYNPFFFFLSILFWEVEASLRRVTKVGGKACKNSLQKNPCKVWKA